MTPISVPPRFRVTKRRWLCKAKRGQFGHVLPCTSPSNRLRAPTGDRRNHQHFVALLEPVLLIPQEADIFLVDVEVDEPPDLSVLSAQMLAQRRKAALNLCHEFGKIRRGARN